MRQKLTNGTWYTHVIKCHMANVEKIVAVQQMIFYGKTNDSMINNSATLTLNWQPTTKQNKAWIIQKNQHWQSCTRRYECPSLIRMHRYVQNLKIPLRICIHKHDIRLFTKKGYSSVSLCLLLKGQMTNTKSQMTNTCM